MIQEYKRQYIEVLATLDNKTWTEYWEVMLRNYEWVDYIFIQSVAWFLRHDIIIISTTSTEDHPYITISGNLIDEMVPCQGIALTIGTLSNVHYQLLLPLEVKMSRNQIKPTSPQNTINLKLSEMTKKLGPDIQSREEFPDLKPSKGMTQVLPRTSTSRTKMQGLGGKSNVVGMNLNKEQNIPSHPQEIEVTERNKQPKENLVLLTNRKEIS